MYVWDLMTCLILLCLSAHASTLSFSARLLNLHDPSKASRSFSLAYAAQVTGSSAAMMERGSKVISAVSHSPLTLYLLPFQSGSEASKGPWCPMMALNL